MVDYNPFELSRGWPVTVSSKPPVAEQSAMIHNALQSIETQCTRFQILTALERNAHRAIRFAVSDRNQHLELPNVFVLFDNQINGFVMQLSPLPKKLQESA